MASQTSLLDRADVVTIAVAAAVAVPSAGPIAFDVDGSRVVAVTVLGSHVLDFDLGVLSIVFGLEDLTLGPFSSSASSSMRIDSSTSPKISSMSSKNKPFVSGTNR